MSAFKNELVRSMVQEYADHGVEITPQFQAAFEMRDRALNLEFMGPEFLAEFEQFDRANPGVLDEMADIEIGFVLG